MVQEPAAHQGHPILFFQTLIDGQAHLLQGQDDIVGLFPDDSCGDVMPPGAQCAADSRRHADDRLSKDIDQEQVVAGTLVRRNVEGAWEKTTLRKGCLATPERRASTSL